MAAETLHPLFERAISDGVSHHVGLNPFGFRDFQRPLFTNARRNAHNVLQVLARAHYDACGGDGERLRGRDVPLVETVPSASAAANLRAHAVANRLLRRTPGAIDTNPDAHNTPLWVTTTTSTVPHGLQSTFDRLSADYDHRHVELRANPDDLGLSFHALRRFLHLSGDDVLDNTLVLKRSERERRAHNVAAAVQALLRRVRDAEKANHSPRFVPAKVVRVDKPRGMHAVALATAAAAREKGVAARRVVKWASLKTRANELRYNADQIAPTRPDYAQLRAAYVGASEASATRTVDEDSYVNVTEADAARRKLRGDFFRDEVQTVRHTVGIHAQARSEGVYEERNVVTTRLADRVMPTESKDE